MNLKTEINTNKNELLQEQTHFEIETCKQSASIKPQNYSTWLNLARLQKNANQIDAAITSYEKIISLNPLCTEAFFELGRIYYILKNNSKKAIEYCEVAIEQEPQNTNANLCLALAYLKTKNYKDGWKYFESRLAGIDNLSGLFPLWDGEDAKDKTILVYAERGYGDTIMFSRFLPLLKSKCKKVLFLPQKNLSELFDEKSLGVQIIKDIREAGFDLHTSIMSLPYKLGLEQESDFPDACGCYLKSDHEKIIFYKEKYFVNNNFKVGINWQGCTEAGAERSFPLEYFERLFKIPNISFYSLQTGEVNIELEKFKDFEITDLGSTFNDFSDTASAIENLDLVISNDTSVGNLAGAMGKECWILIPYTQDWRWSEDLSYCHWYKNATLLKQSELNCWSDVFDVVYKKLVEFVCKKS